MYKRRIKIFMAVIGAGMVILLVRLGYLQIVRGEHYRRQITESLRNTQLLPATRGQILDRNGAILAIDQPCFDLCLDYRFITADEHPDWVRRRQRRIARELGVSAERAKEIYERRAADTWALAMRAGASLEELEESVTRIRRRVQAIRRIVGMEVLEERQAHAVVRGLDEETAVEIKAGLEGTIGATVRPSHKRWYPYRDLACHLIGLTGQVTGADQATHNLPADAPWLRRMLENYLDGDTIGKRGVERLCEDILRGRRGHRRISLETGEVIGGAGKPAQLGGDVHLTIDIELQRRLKALFREKMPDASGAIVVLQLPRSEVLAAVSVPGFDLNTYRRRATELYNDNVDFPLICRTLTRLYAPGSTAKPLSALGALGEGTLSLHTSYTCTGYLIPGVYDRFRCWIAGRGAHGPLDVTGGIRHSCNIFFYHVGETLERARRGALRDWFGRFGYLDPPGTGLPEEAAGRFPEHITHLGNARMLAMGQGPIAVTPTHVANAMATIARRGEYRSPMLVLEGAPAPVRRDLGLAGGHLDAVQLGMHQVVDDRRGTAYRYFHLGDAEPLGMDICGKSGTAQTPPLRADTDGDGRIDVVRSGNHLWFAGFAPYRNPKVAFAVVIEHQTEGGGSSVAGPVAREALRICKELGYL